MSTTERDEARALAKESYEYGLQCQPASQFVYFTPNAGGVETRVWAVVIGDAGLQSNRDNVDHARTCVLWLGRDPTSEAGGVEALAIGDRFRLENDPPGRSYAFVGEVIEETDISYQIRVALDDAQRFGTNATDGQ